MTKKLKALFYFMVVIHILNHCENTPKTQGFTPKPYYPDTLNKKSN
jgi:hypothetical protein